VTSKSEFNAEEWQTIAEAPVFAGLRVVAAGRGGTIRESIAVAKVYTHARENQDDSELLDELVAAPPSVNTDEVRSAGSDIATVSTDRLRGALSILAGKATPEEIEDYKQFILAVAQAAAEAHKEGGFIGIGGKPVSEQEQAALDEIRTVLG
jgi:hypothetical protein